jgi:hypothetical protein
VVDLLRRSGGGAAELARRSFQSRVARTCCGSAAGEQTWEGQVYVTSLSDLVRPLPAPGLGTRANVCFAARDGYPRGRRALASTSGPSARTPSQSRAAPKGAAPPPLSALPAAQADVGRLLCGDMPPCRSCEGGQRAELRFAGAPPAALLFESYGVARPCDIAEVRRRPSAGLHAGQKPLSALAVPAAVLQGCAPGGVGVACKASMAPAGPACSRPSMQCACAKHSRRRPAQGFDLKEHGFCAPGCGDLAYDLVAVACHARKHIIAYVRVQGIFYRADDADVRCVGARVSAVQADMRERAYTPRLVAYAARHAT